MSRPTIRIALVRSALFAITIFAAPGVCAGATFSVNTVVDLVDDNLNDGVCHTAANTCSLRAAFTQANNVAGAGSTLIELPAGVYLLSLANGLYLGNASHPNRSTIVSGAGASSTIIDLNQSGNLTIDSSHSVLVSGVSIRNGLANYGGGIDNAGLLTLLRCNIEENHSFNEGGGIGNVGDLNVLQSTIRANTARYAGGIANDGTTRISESLLTGNDAEYDGGGILNTGSFSGSRHLYVINSTFSANHANNNGGAIFSDFDNSITFLYNTSLIGNGADEDHDENGGVGGGIYSATGSRVVLVNALLAGNTRTVFSDDDCYGSYETYGRNFFSTAQDCASNNGGTLYHVSPTSIGQLQDNGGPTLSHALFGNSEAIDSAQFGLGCVSETGAHLETDQRGAPRPSVNQFCDAGAFEYESVVPIDDLIFRSGFDGSP